MKKKLVLAFSLLIAASAAQAADIQYICQNGVGHNTVVDHQDGSISVDGTFVQTFDKNLDLIDCSTRLSRKESNPQKYSGADCSGNAVEVSFFNDGEEQVIKKAQDGGVSDIEACSSSP